MNKLRSVEQAKDECDECQAVSELRADADYRTRMYLVLPEIEEFERAAIANEMEADDDSRDS